MAASAPASDPVFALSSRFVDEYAAVKPVQASMAGVPGVFDTWDDYSPEGGAAARVFLGRYRDALGKLPAATDRFGDLARRVMAD